MKIRSDTVKIDLESVADLKDYYFLTLILGTGLVLSIAIFVGIVQFKFNGMHKEFEGQAQIIASGLDLAFSNRIAALQNLETELQHSDFLSSREPMPRIDEQLKTTGFERVLFLRLDPVTHDITLPWDYSLDRSEKSLAIGDQTIWAIREVLNNLSAASPNDSALFLERDNKTKFVVIRKYLHSNREYLITFSDAESLFRREMEPGIQLYIEQQWRSGAKAFRVDNRDSDVRLLPVTGIDLRKRQLGSSLQTVKTIPALGDLMRFHIFRNHETLAILALPLFSVLACLTITCLIALLVFNLINRNIEVQKLVEQKTRDLEAESKKALEAADAKTRFLANVSHEVRTPLNLILGMADLLRETQLTEEQARFVENFSRAGNHLLRLIGDILDVARLDADGIKIFPDRVNILKFFEELTDFVAPSCLIKGLNLNLNIDPQLPAEATFDPARVRQIVLNLLNNSLKFTDTGSISIEVQRHTVTGGRAGIRIKVADTGIGIPGDQIENVFNEFYQVDGSATRSRGGAGLGLAIVRAIVDKLDGKIEVHSELNVGTEIAVLLPVEFNSQTAIKDLVFWKEKPKRIGVLFSDAKLSEEAFGWLGLLGIRVDTVPLSVANLKEAKVWLGECDYVFVELSPETQLSWIRVLKESVSRETRLVIVTKGHLQTEMARALSEGWQYSVLSIPALPSRMVGVMGGVIRSAPRPAITRAASEPRPAEVEVPDGFKVLIVEDDYDNRLLLEAYLAKLPYRFEFATNGRDALASFASERPGLIVTDLQMPVMDGFTFIEKVRRGEATEGLPPCPIVILTADAQEETVRKAKNFQVEKFLTKPVRKRDFIEVLNEFAQSL